MIIGDPGRSSLIAPPELQQNFNVREKKPKKRPKVLFDLSRDPSEKHDLSMSHPDIVRDMEKNLWYQIILLILLLCSHYRKFQRSMVAPDTGEIANKDLVFNGVWRTGWCMPN